MGRIWIELELKAESSRQAAGSGELASRLAGHGHACGFGYGIKTANGGASSKSLGALTMYVTMER